MIAAFIFDLDGTLVQTEILKAHSYAKAAVMLKPGNVKESDVVEAYKKLAGRARDEVAKSLMEKFDLEKESEKQMKSFNVEKPRDAFIQMRLKFYFGFLAEPGILKKFICPYTTALLEKVKSQNYKTALATTSHTDEAYLVLETLGIKDFFDCIATRDDVVHSKPDSEIYNLVLSKLYLEPQDAIAIEDSVTGIKAALAAKMNCIAVTNSYTKEDVNNSKLLNGNWIVNDPQKLDGIAQEMIRRNS